MSQIIKKNMFTIIFNSRKNKGNFEVEWLSHPNMVDHLDDGMKQPLPASVQLFRGQFLTIFYDMKFNVPLYNLL